MIVEGVDRYRVCEPLFECVRVVLHHRGEDYSPAYLQGISGAAFRIAGICPCAPTCSFAMWTPELVELLGYECEVVPASLQEREDSLQQALARIKDEVRAGRPVIVWNAFTFYEWDVVCGFDEDAGELLGRGSFVGMEDYARAKQTRIADGWDVTHEAALVIGEKTGELDRRAAEIAALEEAVLHARWTETRPPDEDEGKWRMMQGLACWDRWADVYRAEPGHEPENGDRYCLGVYMHTHRAAAEFLREIAPGYPEARDALQDAATHFAAEAEPLDELRAIDGWNWERKPTGEEADGRRAAELLTRARDEYALGIDAIEDAVATITGRP